MNLEQIIYLFWPLWKKLNSFYPFYNRTTTWELFVAILKLIFYLRAKIFIAPMCSQT